MTDADSKLNTYTPGPERRFWYTVKVTQTRYLSGVVTSDADEETSKEILLENLREGTDLDFDYTEFREATEEDLAVLKEFTEKEKENSTIN